jgi:hypothetical protein
MKNTKSATNGQVTYILHVFQMNICHDIQIGPKDNYTKTSYKEVFYKEEPTFKNRQTFSDTILLRVVNASTVS